MSLSRYLAPAILAATLGIAAVVAPVPAQAQSHPNDLVRVLVTAADVAMRGNTPYYRYGHYRDSDRLIAVRDRHGRVVYYRNVPREQYRNGPPRGNAYGHNRHRPVKSRVICDRHGRCTTTYYDPHHDRDGHRR